MDITTDLNDRVAARQLRESILHYMGSADFYPANSISFHSMKRIIEKNIGEEGSTVHSGNELATGKTSESDSEGLPEHAAAMGNNGSCGTFWCTADEKTSHWWQVDLGMVKEIWRTAVNQTGNTANDQIRIDRFNSKARFLRIVYNGVPTGVKAGHYQFEVYGK